jgi:hypothetical protein
MPAIAANAPAPQLIPSGSASGGMAADAGGVKSEPSQDVKGLSVGVARGGPGGRCQVRGFSGLQA